MFSNFNKATKASMICKLNNSTQKYDCKMGYDREIELLFGKKDFEFKESVCQNDMNDYIKSLGAVEISKISKTKHSEKDFVIIDKNSTVNLYCFDNCNEIHFVKFCQNKTTI